uniref:Ig-like domain-containing protein n=1 Tax=Terrapene triunguis TaxID=2587831 RepID=A0A674KHJ8_9SAUR
MSPHCRNLLPETLHLPEPQAEMYPKPTISLSPGRLTALGQDVTVRCRAGHRDARFSLFKVGDRTPLGRAQPAGVVGEFLIHSVRRGDGGSYTCYYHYATDPFTWSEPSDPVELVVAGEGPGSVSRAQGLPNPHRPSHINPTHTREGP